MTIADPDVSVESIVAKETASSAAKKKLSSPWASLAAVVIAIMWTIPTAGLLISSFRPEDDVKSTGWWTVLSDPNFTLDNYKTVIQGGDVDLGTYFVNTIVITIPAVIIPVCLAVLAAYAFAWMKFPGRDFLFVAVFALQIVPIQVTMIPLLKLYVQSFRSNNAGLGAALATMIFVLVLPIVIYNVRQMRKLEAR